MIQTHYIQAYLLLCCLRWLESGDLQRNWNSEETQTETDLERGFSRLSPHPTPLGKEIPLKMWRLLRTVECIYPNFQAVWSYCQRTSIVCVLQLNLPDRLAGWANHKVGTLNVCFKQRHPVSIALWFYSIDQIILFI